MLSLCQNSNLNWTYIEQLGTNAMWSAVSSDSSGQNLIASQTYNQALVVMSSDYGERFLFSNDNNYF